MWSQFRSKRTKQRTEQRSSGDSRPIIEGLEGRNLLSFSAPVTSAGGGDGLAVGDFNADGRTDVAVFDSKNRVAVSLSNGDGTFRLSSTLSGLTGTPWRIVPGDSNGDGRLDISAWSLKSNTKNSGGKTSGAVAQGGCLQGLGGCGGTSTPTTVYLSTWLGNGDGTFGPASNTTFVWSWGTPSGPENPTWAQPDVNGDGLNDAVYLSSQGDVLVYLTNGGETALRFPAGPSPRSIAPGDFNGDGRADLVVVNSLSAGKTSFSVLLNDGSW
jgi:hypothetical protein